MCVCVCCCKSVYGGGCWRDLDPINSPVWTTGPNSAFLSAHMGFSPSGLCPRLSRGVARLYAGPNHPPPPPPTLTTSTLNSHITPSNLNSLHLDQDRQNGSHLK